MKKIFTLFLACVCFSGIHAQTVASVSSGTPACCIMPTGMAAMAMNERFIASHLEPVPFNYQGKGTWIGMKTADGKDARGYLVKATKPSNKWLMVCQEWWGVNDYILQRADELQQELGGDVNVLAIDFYDGKVATTRDSASVYASHINPARIGAICDAAVEYTGADAHIVTIGWCMGGAFSVEVAAAAGKKGVGCVTYYGLPDAKTFTVDKLNCDIDGFFAGKDDWVNEKFINTFNTMLKEHHKTMVYKVYPNAVHAFANPSNPKYDKEAATDANALSLKYIKGKFGLR